MADQPDYIVDVPGLADANQPSQAPGAGRKWIGVRFDCCGLYQRIYRNRDGSAYEGRCPHCLRVVRALIGPHGTGARFFVAE